MSDEQRRLLTDLLAREAVRDLIAVYAHGVDGRDFEAVAGCFTPDGVLSIEGHTAFSGRQEIEQGLSVRLPKDDPPRHFVTGTRFVAAGEHEIETTPYFLRLSKQGLQHWGTYTDRIVHDGERWLFARRHVVVEHEIPVPKGEER